MKELYRFRQFLAEGVIKENEEQGYTLYTTNVEYDNGKTGYMYQLVNSEDKEENEIGFDQLYFDDEDNRLEMGVDFKDFDQGSYQEGEYTADEAMKLYKDLAESKLLKEEQMMGKYIQTKHPDGYDMIMSFSMPDEGELGLDYGTLDEILEVKEIDGVKVYCVYI